LERNAVGRRTGENSGVNERIVIGFPNIRRRESQKGGKEHVKQTKRTGRVAAATEKKGSLMPRKDAWSGGGDSCGQ